MVGHLAQREGQLDTLLGLIKTLGAVCATTFSCKHGTFEDLDHSVGIYSGLMSRASAKDAVEGADVVITAGVTYNEFDTGVYTEQLEMTSFVHILQSRVIVNKKVCGSIFLRSPGICPVLHHRTIGITAS